MAYGKTRETTLAVLLLSGTLFAAADWETAAELRKNDEIEKAEKSLKKYGSPAGFEQLLRYGLDWGKTCICVWKCDTFY